MSTSPFFSTLFEIKKTLIIFYIAFSFFKDGRWKEFLNFIQAWKIDLEEVESVFHIRDGVSLGRQISPPVLEERLCIVDPSHTGRMLSIVFTLRDGRVRPISSRLASRKERSLYEEVRKEIEKL